MNRLCRIVATAGLLLAAAPAFAQSPPPDPASLRGDSAQTRKRLAEADQKVLTGKAADAIDDLQRVLDEAADDLVTLDGKQYRPARSVAHQILAKLPPVVLKGYRDRIDEPARKLLDAAKRTRDPAPLWQLLDRYFVSRPADEGLLLLGDLLFEKGDFRRAEGVWRRLLPDTNPEAVYPGSKADPAAVRARIILAATFAGELARAEAELAAFKEKHPDAKGPLAGKDGPLAATLQTFLAAPPRVPPAANPGTDWPMLGGEPDRSGRVGVRLPGEWPARPTWAASLAPDPERFRGGGGPPARPPFGSPVIAHGQVFVTDGARVFGFDLHTGKATAARTPTRPGPLDRRPAPDPSPALAAAGDRLYVRLGPPALRAPGPTDGPRAGDDTALACLRLGPAEDAGGLKELWRVTPPAGEGMSPTAWEGAPLVAGRRMWAAYARFEGGRVIHGIACFDPADATAAPETPAWAVDVCDSPTPATADGRSRHELLTLAGRNVVFCSNTGAVVALDAATGRRAWGFRYPRSRKADMARPDPAPAAFSGGRVFVAPADADRVFALDPETGELLWTSTPMEAAQIVGVAGGRLVVSVGGQVRGLRGMNAVTGSQRDGGWVLHDGGGLLGYGRGFVTDDAIVWPTERGLYFVRPADGTRIWTPHGDRPNGYLGNVAYADGVLVVVTPTQVWGYVSPQRRFGPWPPPLDRDPRREQFDNLKAGAERLLAAGEPAAARESLLAAARGPFPNPLRAWAAARLLLLTPKADDEAKFPTDLRMALGTELRGEWLIPPDGVPVTLQGLIDRHLGRVAAQEFQPPSPSAVCERKPEDAPALGADAGIDRILKLEPGSTPLRWLPGMATPPKRLFVSTPTSLLAIPLADGDTTRHAAAGRFTHAADTAGGFVAAGPLAVAVYAAGRGPVWVFRVPVTDPLPATPGEYRIDSDDLPPAAELSSFRLTGSWLVARLGDRHLIALDLKDRRVAWVLGANGTPGFRPNGFPDAPRFGPEFAAAGRSLLAQLSDGRRWFVRVETGRVLDPPGLGGETAKAWWPHPPAEVAADRLAVADGAGVVRLLHLTTGRVKWTRRENGESGLHGDPPQVLAFGDTMLLAVRRNHGVELVRIDPSDGLATWDEPAFLDTDRVNLANADADAERVYVPVGNTLAAFALKDGKPAWEAELPAAHAAGGWVVRAGRKCVIAYPEAALPREPVADVLARVVRSFAREPAPWRLPGPAAGLYDAWVARTVPVLLLDPETGAELARFGLPAAGPAVTAWFERDTAVVATGDRVVWLR